MRVRLSPFVLVCSLLVGCHKEERPKGDTSAEQKRTKDREGLRTLDVVDGFAYASGHYANSHNHPVIFALVREQKIVMMARSARGEVPLSDPKAALQAYEELLLNNGYSPNGKARRDDNTYVMVDGGKMVAVPMDKIFPKMPDEQRARFTAEQLTILGATASGELHLQFAGYYGDRTEVPAMYAYSQSLEVIGKSYRRAFQMAQASDAFAEYEALLKRVSSAR